MPTLDRIEKVRCKNCGIQTTQPNLARHKKRCPAGTKHCTKCSNFSTKFQNGLNYQITTNHSAQKFYVTFKCKLCYQAFPGFHVLRQHKNTQHGFLINSANVDPDKIINEVDDVNIEEELRSCQHLLVDSELERALHKVFNYARENPMRTCDRKFDQFFNFKLERKCIKLSDSLYEK